MMKMVDLTLVVVLGLLLALSNSVELIKLAAIALALTLGALVVLWAFDPSKQKE
jgi:hypothetical protein